MAARSWSIEITDFLGLSPSYFDAREGYVVAGDPRYAAIADGVDLATNKGLGQGFGLTTLTAGNESGAVTTLVRYIIDFPFSTGVTIGGGGNLLHQINASQVINTGAWPHTIDKAVVTGETLKGLCHYSGAIYYAYNTSGSPDIGKWDLAATFDDDFMSTVPTNGAVLPDGSASEHPMVVGGDNIMYIGAGRYVSSYNATTNVFTAQALDLPAGMDIVDIRWHQGRLWIAANRGNLGSQDKAFSQIYVWDTFSDSWEYDIAVVGRIGTMYIKDGAIYLWWREVDSTVNDAVVSKFGYLEGLIPTVIRSYNGGLPNHGQVTHRRGFIFWGSPLSDAGTPPYEHIFAYGSPDPTIQPRLYMPVSSELINAVGAIASPFGSLLIGYDTIGGVFTLARMDDDNVTPSVYATTTLYESPWVRIGNVNQKMVVNKIVVMTNPLASGAKADMNLYTRDAGGTVTTALTQIATTNKMRHIVYESSKECNEFKWDVDWFNGSTSSPVVITSIYIEGELIDAGA